jgi:hypothetical protein
MKKMMIVFGLFVCILANYRNAEAHVNVWVAPNPYYYNQPYGYVAPQAQVYYPPAYQQAYPMPSGQYYMPQVYVQPRVNVGYYGGGYYNNGGGYYGGGYNNGGYYHHNGGYGGGYGHCGGYRR